MHSDDSNLLSFDFDAMTFDAMPAKAPKERNYREEAFNRRSAAYTEKLAPVVEAPALVSVTYLGTGAAMDVFVVVPSKRGSKVTKSSVTRSTGRDLEREINRAIAAHPGCKIVCSPKRSWVRA